jgi:hypothetical protein
MSNDLIPGAARGIGSFQRDYTKLIHLIYEWIIFRSIRLADNNNSLA